MRAANSLRKRAAYYEDAYGRLPFFKAGLHGGKITAVEIGEIKRDIAYHGDTINTAARIQSLCNTYNKSLLVSKGFTEEDGFASQFTAASLGMVMLKGKKEGVELVSVEGRVGSFSRESGEIQLATNTHKLTRNNTIEYGFFCLRQYEYGEYRLTRIRHG